MHSNFDLNEALKHINPAGMPYAEWLAVGMGLKESGYPVEIWDEWSRQDPAGYHDGECIRKWESFHGSPTPITGRSIVKMAMDNGWSPSGTGAALDWDAVIGGADSEPANPAQELIDYLTALFEPSEYVGYVTETFEKDGERKPTSGCYDRTAEQLIAELRRCNGDTGAVLGDSDPDAGAWIRINPLDGEDVKNDNVTAFRHALIESDDLPLEEQLEKIRELELPAAAIVYSGGKSIHAIVRIDADNPDVYRERVRYLYDICEKNDFPVDRGNRNPARLSRLPGAMRAGKRQRLIAVNVGKPSWDAWKNWIETVSDDLPDPENMAAVWDNLPALAPPLISGILRQGHKLLLSGPSKAGKSYALIELCCAIAEGRPWLGSFQCAQGRVLYVNLELDRASCLNRFRDVYTALGYPPGHLQYIDVWNLRGRSIPMDKLAPKLIRRAGKKDYIAIVIDPIYKIITGDENSADQMAKFCNQFDKVCTELGCAVIYCHHHSKGLQGAKRAMDRASGSGVFARDPDALLDIIELPVSDALRQQQRNAAVRRAATGILTTASRLDGVSQDDLCSEKHALEAMKSVLTDSQYADALDALDAAGSAADAQTAWRIECTLREFPKPPNVNLWFDYPIHRADDTGVLADVDPEEEKPPWAKATEKSVKSSKQRREKKEQDFITAVENCNMGEPPTLTNLMEWFAEENGSGISEKTIRRWIKQFGYFIDRNTGLIYPKESKTDCPEDDE